MNSLIVIIIRKKEITIHNNAKFPSKYCVLATDISNELGTHFHKLMKRKGAVRASTLGDVSSHFLINVEKKGKRVLQSAGFLPTFLAEELSEANHEPLKNLFANKKVGATRLERQKTNYKPL